MPRVWLGESKCASCGETIEDMTWLGFPSFASGPDDPHRRYSGAVFHRNCYATLPEREAIEGRITEMIAETKTGAVGWWTPPDISDTA